MRVITPASYVVDGKAQDLVIELGSVILSAEEWRDVSDLWQTSIAVAERELREGNGGFTLLANYARRVKALEEKREEICK